MRKWHSFLLCYLFSLYRFKFRCNACRISIKCDHSGQKSMLDHISTKSHQERAKEEDEQPRLFFESAADKSLKEKVYRLN